MESLAPKAERIKFRDALGRNALRSVPRLASAIGEVETTPAGLVASPRDTGADADTGRISDATDNTVVTARPPPTVKPAVRPLGHSPGSLTKSVASAERLLDELVKSQFIAGWRSVPPPLSFLDLSTRTNLLPPSPSYTGESLPAETPDVVCIQPTSSGLCSVKRTSNGVPSAQFPATGKSSTTTAAGGVAASSSGGGDGGGGFPDDVDVETWEEGGSARFYLLLVSC